MASGLLGLGLLAACGDAGDGQPMPSTGGGGGKADSAPLPYVDGTKGSCTLLAAANRATPDELAASGIPVTAARAILAFRAGADGQPGTRDDQVIDTVADLDAIPGVGPVSLQKLYSYGLSSAYNCRATAPLPMPAPAPTPPPPPSGALAAFEGINWVNTTSRPTDGDILSFRLTSGDYVRLRCYGSGCAQVIPETERVQLYVGSTGKRYLDFMSFVKRGPDLDPRPVIRDSYELQVVSSASIKLRKTRSSTWRTFKATPDLDLCTSSGGDWNGAATADAVDACDCHGPSGWNGVGYVGGAGCIRFTDPGEDGCDSSGGSYRDDDANRIGTYCDCPVDQHLTADGCVDI